MDIPGWTTPPKLKEIEPARPMGWERLSKEDQDLSDRLSIGQQQMEWSMQTAATALNTARVVGVLFFVLNASQIAVVIRDWILK